MKGMMRAAALVVLCLAAPTCTAQQRDSMAAKTQAAKILERHTLEWMTIPGVVGAGEGIHRGKPCILILVEKKTRELSKTFPPTIDGVRIVLKEVGRVRKM